MTKQETTKEEDVKSFFERVHKEAIDSIRKQGEDYYILTHTKANSHSPEYSSATSQPPILPTIPATGTHDNPQTTQSSA